MTRTPPCAAIDWCLFLDVDGTLIELTDTPFETHVGDELKALLTVVGSRLNGALALVSGRSIDYLDALFAPLRLPTAGLHGVERRSAAGVREGAIGGDPQLDVARTHLRELVRAHPGTLLEDKGKTVAVHYRLAPQFESVMRASVTAIAAPLGGLYHVQTGNLMLEIKPSSFSKGSAITEFLGEPPFAGRTPIFVGDDLTDLDGFRVVEAQGGWSIGVGDRVAGRYQLAGPAAVRGWLAGIAASLAGTR